MMNLTARTPSFVSSSTSSNPGRTWYGYQDPGESVAINDRSGKPDRLSPPGYSKEDYGFEKKSIEPEEFTEWIIFVSMFSQRLDKERK